MTSACLLAAVWAGWPLRCGRSWRRAGMVVGLWTALASLTLLYNSLQTGDPLTSPFQLASPEERIGFSQARGIIPQHTPVRALANAVQWLSLLDFHLLGWLGASLIFVVPLALVFRMRRDGPARCRQTAMAYALNGAVAGFSAFRPAAPYWCLRPGAIP